MFGASRVKRGLVEFLLDESGYVTSPRIVVGHSLLRKAALKAVEGWKFERAIIKGQPAKILGAITLCFQGNKKSQKAVIVFPSSNVVRLG